MYKYFVFVNICMHMGAGVSSLGNVDSATFLPATRFCFRQRPFHSQAAGPNEQM